VHWNQSQRKRSRSSNSISPDSTSASNKNQGNSLCDAISWTKPIKISALLPVLTDMPLSSKIWGLNFHRLQPIMTASLEATFLLLAKNQRQQKIQKHMRPLVCDKSLAQSIVTRRVYHARPGGAIQKILSPAPDQA
jgi:hypothetical protein